MAVALPDAMHTLLGNAIVASHIGARRRTRFPIATVLSAAAIAALLGFSATPTAMGGVLAVTLVGFAAWTVARAIGVRWRPDRPRAANDNPPRPVLPLHALRW